MLAAGPPNKSAALGAKYGVLLPVLTRLSAVTLRVPLPVATTSDPTWESVKTNAAWVCDAVAAKKAEAKSEAKEHFIGLRAADVKYEVGEVMGLTRAERSVKKNCERVVRYPEAPNGAKLSDGSWRGRTWQKVKT